MSSQDEVPYNDDEVAAFCTDCEIAFDKAQQPWNARAGVWPARMQADATGYAGQPPMGYAAARAKQLRLLYISLGLTPPFEPAPRVWRTNMCGMHIAGLPAVPGGAADPTLFLSWFYDRYDAPTRATIRQAAKARGWVQWLVSWPDSRAVGATPTTFGLMVEELIADGFFPCPFLYSKDYDPSDFAGIMANINPVLPVLVGLAPAVCIGWELSIALSPTTVQQLIDAIAPQFTPSGAHVYVHFQQGYFSFQQDGHPGADFWKLQVGKLTGILHQRVQDGPDTWDKPMYQARLVDCLQRFAGQFFYPSDSGFGHPFDIVALEITAVPQFNGQMGEAEGDTWGETAVTTPPVDGPLGPVSVMGSGNGLP